MFEQNPKLRNIHPTKLRIINEIKEQSKYQSAEELLPQILQINQELKRRNLSFTKEESALLSKQWRKACPRRSVRNSR